jgi:co-chaperonin GroES (HSP10)
MKVQMVGKKLLIEPSRLAEKTEGGILIPEPVRSISVSTGRVLAAGDTLPKEGDEVLYDAGTSVKVKIDGKDLDLVTEAQVHAILGK